MTTNVKYFRAYEDGSGAPALIQAGRYTFAFDLLGEVKRHLVSPSYGARVECKIALAAAAKEYDALLAHSIDATWRALNAAMYDAR